MPKEAIEIMTSMMMIGTANTKAAVEMGQEEEEEDETPVQKFVLFVFLIKH